MVTRGERLYLLLLFLASLCLSMQFATMAAPGSEADEGMHQAYAEYVASGRLPTVDTFYHGVADSPQSTIWVANHPPGFYALGAPAVWLGELTDSRYLTLFLLRLLGAVGSAALVVVAGVLARALIPHRPAALLVAAAVQAAMSAVTFDAGAVYNDGLAASLGGGALVLAVWVLRSGATPRRLRWLTGFCAAAALTRSPGVVVTVLCVVAVVLAAALHRSPRRPFAPTALRGVLLVGGVPALLAGWFYVRNWVLYGDPTASAYLLDRFGRESREWDLQDRLAFLPVLWDRLFVQHRAGDPLDPWVGVIRNVGWVVLAGLGVGLLVGVVGRVVGRVVPPLRGRFGRLDPGTVGGWLLAAAYVVVTLVAVSDFVADGGGAHERYLLPIAPILASLTAAGLFGLVSWLRPRSGPEGVAVRSVAGAAVVFFLGWALWAQVVTAAWVVDRPQNARGVGPLGGDVLPWVFYGVAALAVVVALGRAVLVLREGWAGDRPDLSPPGRPDAHPAARRALAPSAP